MIGKINFNDYKIFSYFSLFWIILGWIAFLLTLAGFFHSWIFEILLITGAILFTYLVFFKKNHVLISQNVKLACLFFLLITISFSTFVTPTIFSGRDQGSISEAAIRLSQNHQLKFSTPASEEFWKINQEKTTFSPEKTLENDFINKLNTTQRALNFPGFHYTSDGKLTTQFPLPYISWLAIFYSIFGINGLVIANAILFYLFFMSLYLTACSISISHKNRSALLCIVFVAFSFVFSWFLKFTLSENMALALIWIGILQVIMTMKSKKEENQIFFLASSITTFGLMMFTRIEGILIFLMTIIVFLLNQKSRKLLTKQKWKFSIITLLFLLAIFIANFFVNIAFFKEMAKATIHTKGVSIDSEISILKILFIYGILFFLILAPIKIFDFLRTKQFIKLIPFIITLPVFAYLINPQISSDHPWMLRRFLFAILPVLILYSSLLIAEISKKKHFWANSLIMLIITFNIPLTINFFTFSENQNLFSQTDELMKNFSKNDLILIDREATGDGWSMISGVSNFIFQKNSAYFFNPDDFEKINKNSFENIYLVTPNKNIDLYENSSLKNNLYSFKDYSITTTKLEKSDQQSIPQKATVTTKGKIFQLK